MPSLNAYESSFISVTKDVEKEVSVTILTFFDIYLV